MTNSAKPAPFARVLPAAPPLASPIARVESAPTAAHSDSLLAAGFALAAIVHGSAPRLSALPQLPLLLLPLRLLAFWRWQPPCRTARAKFLRVVPVARNAARPFALSRCLLPPDLHWPAAPDNPAPRPQSRPAPPPHPLRRWKWLSGLRSEESED